MKKIIFIITIFICLLANSLFAQRTITGTVVAEDGYGIPGVSVRAKGYTDIGTVTDLDGKYSLNISSDVTAIIFSFVGMITQEVEITSDIVNVTLESEDLEVEEVVVTSIGVTSSSRSLGYASATTGWSSTKSERKKKSKASAPAYDGAAVYDAPVTESSKVTDDYEGTYETTNGISSGKLTAGEINDFAKWKLWNDITTNEFKDYQDYWKFYFNNRVTIQLKNSQNTPVIGAKIDLVVDDKIIWSSVSDNTGKAELWGNIYKSEELKKSYLSINYKGKTTKYEEVKKFVDGINFVQLTDNCDVPQNVDIAFVVDATGSMGDEISYLQAELSDVISRVKVDNQNMNFNLATVFYQDFGDVYLTKQSNFTSSIENAISFIKQQYAGGGGDFPEAVDVGLDSAINNLSWREETTAKILFLILDAPPHYTPEIVENLHRLALTASQKGIRIVPVTCSGIDKQTEFLMRSLALATNGTYVFLTDDSGIGDAHIAPSTDEWKVETLNDLLIRVINQYSSAIDCEQVLQIVQQKSDTLIVENKSEIKNRENEKLLLDSLNSLKSDTLNLLKSDTLNIQNPENVVDENIENIDEQTDVEEIEPEILYSLKYYPNPTSGIFTIEIDGSIGEIFITDVSGKIIQRYKIEDTNQISVDITSFPAGFYLIRYFVTDDKFLDGKVIKY